MCESQEGLRRFLFTFHSSSSSILLAKSLHSPTPPQRLLPHRRSLPASASAAASAAPSAFPAHYASRRAAGSGVAGLTAASCKCFRRRIIVRVRRRRRLSDYVHLIRLFLFCLHLFTALVQLAVGSLLLATTTLLLLRHVKQLAAFSLVIPHRPPRARPPPPLLVADPQLEPVRQELKRLVPCIVPLSLLRDLRELGPLPDPMAVFEVSHRLGVVRKAVEVSEQLAHVVRRELAEAVDLFDSNERLL
mmetsp:Transcript_30088/g.52858  ORF Transcript_30088/g.52858 Transcript_30088/m.52858 type:complete len:247 (-) Transcript_30088:1035-1775(-)